MNDFSFEKQTPADASPFPSFVVRNKCEFQETESAEIIFVDTGLYYDKHIAFVDVVFLMNNTYFDNPHVKLSLIGKLRNKEYMGLNYGLSDFVIRNNDRVSYGFMRSFLIADGFMNENCYDAIITSKTSLREYLTGKEIVLDGGMLREGLMKVLEVS